MTTVAHELSRHVTAGERHHLIAHSFGTWIAAQLMKRPGVRFDRVVFAGSPLACDLDWHAELADNPGAFRDLANECGYQDVVIKIPGLSGSACAGSVGFQGPVELIHNTGAYRESCRLCNELPESAQARIHNLEWKAYKHSGWFVGNGHSANLWLPYFWGFSPQEYGDFIEACLRLADLADRCDWPSMVSEQGAFAARSWSWTRHRSKTTSLKNYVEKSVGAFLRVNGYPHDRRTVSSIRNHAIRLIWVIIGGAIEERRKSRGKSHEHIVRRLHPQLAVNAAVHIAVTRHSWTTGG